MALNSFATERFFYKNNCRLSISYTKKLKTCKVGNPFSRHKTRLEARVTLFVCHWQFRPLKSPNIASIL
ncbi:hypothetical protein CEK71_01800 [Methylovulum psychrotolerans]|uniref:Uncharacterized protein n=1 Tax=Methylovulum psychrotolerans TaxID=1704499 RepID=A0A1Z4BUL5_9GAMM|nr:hypothetical protein CEK71_01800 [Methylovulum psychrotolerans]